MTTGTSQLLTNAWVALYDATDDGDFVGSIQKIAGSGDALFRVAASPPDNNDVTDGMIATEIPIPITLRDADGDILYVRSPGSNVRVILG